MAVLGGILYGLLTYSIVLLLDFQYQIPITAGSFVFLFYLCSRLLILFSGIDSPYYSKGRKEISKEPGQKNHFYLTTQWVGKFYHYHDIVLFVFLVAISIAFLITLIIDWLGNKPIGNTIQNLWDVLIPLT